MKIRVLGSAAGGGFPQWNCNCRLCTGVRNKTLSAQERTQSSITVSGDEINWLLINASPDIRQQLASFPALQPARAPRDTGIRSILLMDGQVDHSLGLMSLREANSLDIYCTRDCEGELRQNFPLLQVLSLYSSISVHPLDWEQTFSISSIPGVTFQTVRMAGIAPPYSPKRSEGITEDSMGLIMRNPESGRQAFYAPGLGELTPELIEIIKGCDVAMIDGTFWKANDMERAGVGTKLAQEMGHLPLAEPGGLLERLEPIQNTRKIFIHINNTNPILDEESPEAKEVKSRGFEVAFDGMEIEL